MAAPLNDLLKKVCPDEIPVPSDQKMKSFLDLKHALLNPPILCLPQYGKLYTIDVDASKGRLGCALLQKQEDGKFLPVGYWSRALNQPSGIILLPKENVSASFGLFFIFDLTWKERGSPQGPTTMR